MKRIYQSIRFLAFLVILTLVPFGCNSGPEEVGPTPQSEEGSGQKYAKYFFYDFEAPEIPPEVAEKMEEAQQKSQSTVEATRLININETRLEGAPYMDFVWLWKGSSEDYVEDEHVHNFDEFIGFIGTRGPEDPHGLGGEIEFWLGGEKYQITKTCLIFVPKGLKHCPIRFTRIDTPILFFSGAFELGEYERTPTEFTDAKAAERNYAKYISYDVNPKKMPPQDDSPEAKSKRDEARRASGSTIESHRILDMDLIEGAPYIDFVWMYKGSEQKPTHPEHAHAWGEIFGYIGAAGQDDPHNLGGEVEFWVDGEKHVLTESCLVWIPPDVPHCPVRFARVDKPILWFTIGIGMEGGKYDFSKPPGEKVEIPSR
jgi:quercetin dioxygenase-like cupin family protein